MIKIKDKERVLIVSVHALKRLDQRCKTFLYQKLVSDAFYQGEEPSDDFLVAKVLNTENWSLENIYRYYKGHLFIFKSKHHKTFLITVI